MAFDTLCGSTPIFANRLNGARHLRLVALGAVDVAMSDVQGKARTLVVEIPGLPAEWRVTRGALLMTFRLVELTGMNVGGSVARGALAASS